MEKFEQPHEVSDVDVAFPARVKHLMPAYDEIPKEFKSSNNRWSEVVSQWFFQGLNPATLTAKEGIDKGKALRHLKCVLGSFEPQHEHKTAGAAYLMSMWFK